MQRCRVSIRIAEGAEVHIHKVGAPEGVGFALSSLLSLPAACVRSTMVNWSDPVTVQQQLCGSSMVCAVLYAVLIASLSCDGKSQSYGGWRIHVRVLTGILRMLRPDCRHVAGR